MADQRASTKSTPDGLYKGVIREGRQIVAECPHVHHNRSNGYYKRWPVPDAGYYRSAWECAESYRQTGKWACKVA